MTTFRPLLSLTARHLVVLAVLVTGSDSQCPSGSVLQSCVGLCYWELTSLYNTSTAQRECQRQGGHLATVPLPSLEQFLIANFDFNIFYPGPSDCVRRLCDSWWLGHQELGGDIAVTWSPHLTLAWWPRLERSLLTGECLRVSLESDFDSTLLWMPGSCSLLRRALCSAWADLPERSDRWRGEAGRLGGTPLVTSHPLSLSRCAASCHLRQGCASFNFQRSSGTCELVSKVKAHPDVRVTPDPGFKHYERCL